MQKIILFAFVCLSSPLIAQKSFFGVDAGINIANQRVISSYGNLVSTNFYQNSIQPTFGFFYQYGLSEVIAIRANAQYMGLGYKNSNATDLDISYLTFPANIYYTANKHLS